MTSQTDIKSLIRSLSNAERNLSDADLMECFGNDTKFVERFRNTFDGKLIHFFGSLSDERQNDFLGYLSKKQYI